MFPQPSPAQARILWLGISSLALAVLLAFIVGTFWVMLWAAEKLSAILLPLAVAGILAYLFDPIVDAFERLKIPRARAIFLVFFLALVLVLGMLATVVPRLIVETQEFVNKAPQLSQELQERVETWLAKSAIGEKARAAWEGDIGKNFQEWLKVRLPSAGNWAIGQLTKAASLFGLLAGFAMIPVFLFYFLLEKRGIETHWTQYLPIHESSIKDELVFILKSINEYLILFFRGQVLVALCDGAILTLGFLIMGLDFAVLLGITAGLLSIVPYLGVAISIIPAVILAAVQFGDWLHPALVLGIFAFVQLMEGLFISPKIMGDRVGLHPLTIIIAVMIGVSLMGGIIGGILAIPLTAALRVLMFRYVWRKPQSPTLRTSQ